MEVRGFLLRICGNKYFKNNISSIYFMLLIFIIRFECERTYKKSRLNQYNKQIFILSYKMDRFKKLFSEINLTVVSLIRNKQ